MLATREGGQKIFPLMIKPKPGEVWALLAPLGIICNFCPRLLCSAGTLCVPIFLFFLQIRTLFADYSQNHGSVADPSISHDEAKAQLGEAFLPPIHLAHNEMFLQDIQNATLGVRSLYDA